MSALLSHPWIASSRGVIRAVSSALLRRAVAFDVLDEMPELLGLDGVDVSRTAMTVDGAFSAEEVVLCFLVGEERSAGVDPFSILALAAMSPTSTQALSMLLDHPSVDLAAIDGHQQTAFHAAALIAPQLARHASSESYSSSCWTLISLQNRHREKVVKAAAALRVLLGRLSKQPVSVIEQVMEQRDVNGLNVLHAVCLLPGLLTQLPELLRPPFIDAIKVNAVCNKHGSPLTIACRSNGERAGCSYSRIPGHVQGFQRV